MAIIDPLPFIFQNNIGEVIDATQVNADFAQIVANVNSRAITAAGIPAPTAPVVSFLTTGTNATYTVPVNILGARALYLEVEMCGGGSGGNGSGAGAALGTLGTDSKFGIILSPPSVLLTAPHAPASVALNAGALAGAVGIGGYDNMAGQNGDGTGGGAISPTVGSRGGSSPLGYPGGVVIAAGLDGVPGAFGAGGSGGGAASASQGGGGSSAGALRALITPTLVSYVYTVGTGGTGGAGANKGGNGGGGLIKVTARWQ